MVSGITGLLAWHHTIIILVLAGQSQEIIIVLLNIFEALIMTNFATSHSSNILCNEVESLHEALDKLLEMCMIELCGLTWLFFHRTSFLFDGSTDREVMVCQA